MKKLALNTGHRVQQEFGILLRSRGGAKYISPIFLIKMLCLFVKQAMNIYGYTRVSAAQTRSASIFLSQVLVSHLGNHLISF
jgi:hypothetical protein